MPKALYRILLALALLLPLEALAGDANDFAAANPAQQAKLLEHWAAEPDAARQPLLEALQQGRFAIDSKLAYIEQDGTFIAAEGDASPPAHRKSCV